MAEFSNSLQGEQQVTELNKFDKIPLIPQQLLIKIFFKWTDEQCSHPAKTLYQNILYYILSQKLSNMGLQVNK